MKHVTLSTIVAAISLVASQSADARHPRGTAHGPTGHSVRPAQVGHRGPAARVQHHAGGRKIGVHGHYAPSRPKFPAKHHVGVHKTGKHVVGGVAGRKTVAHGKAGAMKHRPFVRPAGHFKKYGKNYHVRHGKRFRFGWYFRGFGHRHWTRCIWMPRYRTYCYWCPCTLQYYYWCQPHACYYPVTYCPTGEYHYDYVPADNAGPMAAGPMDNAGPMAAGPMDDAGADAPADAGSDE